MAIKGRFTKKTEQSEMHVHLATEVQSTGSKNVWKWSWNREIHNSWTHRRLWELNLKSLTFRWSSESTPSTHQRIKQILPNQSILDLDSQNSNGLKAAKSDLTVQAHRTHKEVSLRVQKSRKTRNRTPRTRVLKLSDTEYQINLYKEETWKRAIRK